MARTLSAVDNANVFVRSTQEDWYVVYSFVDANRDPIDITAAGRNFKVPFKFNGVGSAVATLDTGDSSLVDSGGGHTFSGRVDNSVTSLLARGEYSADFIMYTASADTLLVAAVLRHALPGRFYQTKRKIETVISLTDGPFVI